MRLLSQSLFFTYSLVVEYVVGSVRGIFGFGQCAHEFIALPFASIYRASSLNASDVSSKGNCRNCRPTDALGKFMCEYLVCKITGSFG